MKTNDFQDLSSLRFYSWAVVTALYENGVIEVSPLESMNLQENGLMADKKKTFTNTHPDESGDMLQSKVESKNTIKALWLPIYAGNRLTAPDVVKNEQVMLFKYSNVDHYYWIDLGHNGLRRLETVKYRFGDLKDYNRRGGDDPERLTDATSYMMTVDTKNKHITFATVKSDGEPVAYEASINTGSGYLQLADDRGNVILIDSMADTIVVKANVEVLIEAGEQITLNAPVIVIGGEVVVGKSLYAKNKVVASGVDVNGNVEVSGHVAAAEFIGPPPVPGDPNPEPVKEISRPTSVPGKMRDRIDGQNANSLSSAGQIGSALKGS